MNVPHDRPRIILASKSPRRKYLLEQAGVTFSIIPSEFDESSVTISEPDTYVKMLAEAKASDISRQHPASWIIGADTIVLIDNTILGKPGFAAEARSMLKQLSGKTHQVFTGYCICCKNKNTSYSDTAKTDVHFKSLSDAEIETLIADGIVLAP